MFQPVYDIRSQESKSRPTVPPTVPEKLSYVVSKLEVDGPALPPGDISYYPRESFEMSLIHTLAAPGSVDSNRQ